MFPSALNRGRMITDVGVLLLPIHITAVLAPTVMRSIRFAADVVCAAEATTAAAAVEKGRGFFCS